MDRKGFYCHKKNAWNYPDVESARRLVPHCEEVPVTKFNDLPGICMECDQLYEEVECSASSSGGIEFESSLAVPEPFTLERLSDLILCKEAAEVLPPD